MWSKFNNLNNFKRQKGAISLITVFLLLSVFLVIGVAISVLMLKQIRMSVAVDQSLRAYQTADSGIEYALYQIIKKGAVSSDNFDGSLCSLGQWHPSGAGYFCLDIIESGGKITGLKSIGRLGETRRAIEVGLEAP